MSDIDLDSIKLYHIVHVDKLPFILNSGRAGQLMCDNDVQKQHLLGTAIGYEQNQRTKNERAHLTLSP